MKQVLRLSIQRNISKENVHAEKFTHTKHYKALMCIYVYWFNLSNSQSHTFSSLIFPAVDRSPVSELLKQETYIMNKISWLKNARIFTSFSPSPWCPSSSRYSWDRGWRFSRSLERFWRRQGDRDECFQEPSP